MIIRGGETLDEEKVIETIKNYGTYKDTGEGRLKTLEELGFKTDEEAEYVLIGGCRIPEAIPHVFKALKYLLDKLEVDYTMLTKEHCCGWMPFGQPAVKAKNEDKIAKAKELSEEFVKENFKQAKSLGATSIALFCAACEPTYTNNAEATDLEIISCNQLINRHFESGEFDMEVDYYPGCFRFRQKITSKPLDISPAKEVLSKIKGLELNYTDTDLCCQIPPHLEHLIDSLATKNIITICSGCYDKLREELGSDFEVKMLPEIVAEAVRS